MINKYALIAGVVLLVFLAPLVSGVNVGVSPASLSFDNVLRGGYMQDSIIVSVDSEEPVGIYLDKRGEISEWLDFSENNFSVSKSNPHQLDVFVRPPEDIPNGNYSGYVSVKTKELGDSQEGHAVGVIRSSIDLSVNVEVTDMENINCKVFKTKVDSVEKGDDIVFDLEIENRGNVILEPSVNIKIWDNNQQNVVREESFIGKGISPPLKEERNFRISSGDMDLGQYWAEVSVLECYSQSTKTFDILEPGALKAQGRILGIVTKEKISTGETIPIEVLFKNTGEKEVDARFEGSVSKDGKILQLLESEKEVVSTSETNKFSFYFTPEKEGKYIIKGRVYYSGKKTFEEIASFNAISKNSFKEAFIWFIYVILGGFILILLRKIIIERRSYLNTIKKSK